MTGENLRLKVLELESARVKQALTEIAKLFDLAVQFGPEISADNAAKILKEGISRVYLPLQRSERQLRSFVQNAKDLIFTLDGNTRKILFISRAIQNILGYDPEDFIGETEGALGKFLDIASFTRLVQIFKLVTQGEFIKDYEVLAKHKNGSNVFLSFMIYPVVMENEMVMVHAIARDVTDQKAVMKALFESYREVEKANEFKAEFLIKATHQLRTPLNAIIGFSELLLTIENAMKPEYRQYVADIYEGGKNLLKLVKNILLFSRLETGITSMNFVQIMIHVLVHDIVQNIRANDPDVNVNFSIDIDPRLEMIWADEEKLKQVFYHLIRNAVDVSQPGHNVVIRGRVLKNYTDLQHYRCPIDEDKRFLNPQYKFVIFSVEDEGCGINEEHQDHIFDLFYQIPDREGRKKAKTGVGLTLVKKVIEMHDGKIWFESNPGSGSTFYFFIPLKTDMMEKQPKAIRSGFHHEATFMERVETPASRQSHEPTPPAFPQPPSAAVKKPGYSPRARPYHTETRPMMKAIDLDKLKTPPEDDES